MGERNGDLGPGVERRGAKGSRGGRSRGHSGGTTTAAHEDAGSLDGLQKPEQLELPGGR